MGSSRACAGYGKLVERIWVRHSWCGSHVCFSIAEIINMLRRLCLELPDVFVARWLVYNDFLMLVKNSGLRACHAGSVFSKTEAIFCSWEINHRHVSVAVSSLRESEPVILGVMTRYWSNQIACLRRGSDFLFGLTIVVDSGSQRHDHGWRLLLIMITGRWDQVVAKIITWLHDVMCEESLSPSSHVTIKIIWSKRGTCVYLVMFDMCIKARQITF